VGDEERYCVDGDVVDGRDDETEWTGGVERVFVHSSSAALETAGEIVCGCCGGGEYDRDAVRRHGLAFMTIPAAAWISTGRDLMSTGRDTAWLCLREDRRGRVA
jgi:hypothetical protein